MSASPRAWSATYHPEHLNAAGERTGSRDPHSSTRATRGPGGGPSQLAILTARDIALDSAVRERILGECDPQRLDRWIARAAISTTIAEALADE